MTKTNTEQKLNREKKSIAGKRGGGQCIYPGFMKLTDTHLCSEARLDLPLLCTTHVRDRLGFSYPMRAWVI